MISRLLKGTLRGGLGRLGFSLTRTAHMETVAYFDTFIRVVNALGVNVVLDVGASRGEYGRHLRDIGYTGHIVSFEPVAENFAILREAAAADGKWSAHRMALGAEDGTATMNVMGYSTLHSLLKPTEYAAEQFGEVSRVARSESVPLRRLDGVIGDVLPPVPAPRVFLKLDTQGYDLRVLDGARGCLDRVLAMQTELSVRALYDGMPGISEALAFLKEASFQPVAFASVVRENDGIRAMEFDCLLVSDAAAVAPASTVAGAAGAHG